MKTENEKLYIVIPAYNERDNIYQVLDDWYPVVEKHCGGGESRLVVIDDGSKDGYVCDHAGICEDASAVSASDQA